MRCVTLRSRQMECLRSAWRCGIDVHLAQACLRRLDDLDDDVNVVMTENIIKDLWRYDFLLERLLRDARVVRKFLIVKGVYVPADEVYHWMKSESIKVDALIDEIVKAREQMYRFFKEYSTRGLKV